MSESQVEALFQRFAEAQDLCSGSELVNSLAQIKQLQGGKKEPTLLDLLKNYVKILQGTESDELTVKETKNEKIKNGF